MQVSLEGCAILVFAMYLYLCFKVRIQNVGVCIDVDYVDPLLEAEEFDRALCLRR